MSRRTVRQPDALLAELLPAVSRSFYLSLRVLPAAVRKPIGIAYLLARTSDTIADTEWIEASRRESALRQLADWIREDGGEPCDFTPFLARCENEAERVLLERAGESVELLEAEDRWEREQIRKVLGHIVSGQNLDLQRFSLASSDNIVGLATDDELEDYIYRVAGCVGEFWTRICFRLVGKKGREPSAQLLQDGVRFGKGLQLINILRDLASDLGQGRCYLPAEALAELNLTPEELNRATVGPKLEPLMSRYIGRTREYLLAGWRYTNALPCRWFRIRLACAWPILIGWRTLDALPADDPLDANRRAKITRGAVRAVLLRSLLAYPFPWVWRRLVRDSGDSKVRTIPG